MTEKRRAARARARERAAASVAAAAAPVALAAPASPARARGWLVQLALIALAVCALRAPGLRTAIFAEDEASYTAAAARMAEDHPPYAAGAVREPPGILVAYAAGTAVVGRDNLRGLHLLACLWVLGTALLVGQLAKLAAPGKANARLASLFYAGFAIVQAPAVQATHGELLASLPLAAAAWLVATGCARRNLARVALAGVACGVATLLHTTALALPIALTLWLVTRRAVFRGPERWLADLARLAALWLGLAAVWFATASALGGTEDLLFWALRLPLATRVPLGAPQLTRMLTWALLLAILWALAVRGLRESARASLAEGTRHDAPDAPAQVVWILALWGAAALAFALPGGEFTAHAGAALVPPLAALAAVGYAAVKADGRWRRATAMLTLVPVAACWLGAWQFETTQRWLGAPPPEDTELLAAYVRTHTAPTDHVFVWGQAPEVYVQADRVAASRFVGCEDLARTPNGFAHLLADLEETRPELLVDTSPGDVHHWQRYPLSRFPQLAAYVAAHYHAVDTVQGAAIYRRTQD